MSVPAWHGGLRPVMRVPIRGRRDGGRGAGKVVGTVAGQRARVLVEMGGASAVANMAASV